MILFIFFSRATTIAQSKTYSAFAKALEENDISKAKALIDNGCHKEIMEYMLQHNQKLEKANYKDLQQKYENPIQCSRESSLWNQHSF